MSQPERVPRTSADITADRLTALKDLIPEAFTEEQIDFGKLRDALGDFVDDSPERYNFTWARKRDAIRNLQAPTSATLIPAPEESINWDTTQHLFIEGDNLEVLKLLYKSYFGKVKLIYIDPPYNTGNDFIYPDDYRDPLRPYLELTGQIDANGHFTSNNTESNGRYHSTWLNMMYPRLFLARQLLRDDGALFVNIDDHEMHNLRFLLNEIFGEENFVASIVWQKKYSVSNDDPGIGSMHDYIVVFQRTAAFQRNLLPRTEKQIQRYTNPDNDPRGPWSSSEYVSSKTKDERPTLWYPIKHPATGEDVWPEESAVWRYSPKKHAVMERENRLYWGPNNSYKRPRLKRFLSEVQQGLVPSTWWPFSEVGHNDEGQKETARLLGPKVFSTPKPIRLIRRILEIGMGDDDIFLDFFSGSGSSAHAVFDLNAEDGGSRQFIAVQLPEQTDRDDYKTIADITNRQIR